MTHHWPFRHLAGALLAAATAVNPCLAQPAEDPRLSSPPSRSYPWPAPVDSQRPLWQGHRTSGGDPWADPFVPDGQLRQRVLAEREAARSRSDALWRGGSQEAAASSAPPSRSSRWFFPWPSSMASRWFSALGQQKTEKLPSDPFLHEPSRGDSFSSPANGDASSANPRSGQALPLRRLPPAEPPPRVALRSSAPSSPRAPDLFEPARIIAMVGDQPILAGDLLGQINEILQPYAANASEEDLGNMREQLMRQLLPQLIDVKLLYLDFLRLVPKERLAQIEQKVSQHFDQSQLDEMVRKAKVSGPWELDAKLRQIGSSLEHHRRLFIEQVFAGHAKNQSVRIDPTVTHEEMLNYYRDHASDYEFPAKARWERLSVRFTNFPSKEQARRALEYMGDQVLEGASLASVARRYSQGPRAHEGGRHDWTTQGSLISEVLDHAIFNQAVGVLGPILEDEQGYHIIRVIERRDAGRVSFLEAQSEIKEKILQARRQAEEKRYLQRLRSQTRIQTIFDDQAQNSTASDVGES